MALVSDLVEMCICQGAREGGGELWGWGNSFGSHEKKNGWREGEVEGGGFDEEEQGQRGRLEGGGEDGRREGWIEDGGALLKGEERK